MKPETPLRLTLLSIIAIVLLTDGIARAQDCTHPSVPTVSLAITGPDAMGNATASITYGFPSWVGDRRVALFLDGNYYTDALVGTASGTMNVAISTACFRREVTHTYEAIATSCSRWNDPNYVATDTKSLSVSTAASVSLAVTATDPDGNVTATIGYSFPNTNSSSQRAVALFIDGVQRFFDTRQDQNGTWTLSVGTQCWTPGTHQFEAFATACSQWNDPDYFATKFASIVVNTKPSVDLSISQTSNGVTGTMTYDYPNTNSSSQRALALFIDGSQVSFENPLTRSGTTTFFTDTACWSGVHPFEAIATECSQWNQENYFSYKTVPVAADHTPTVHASLDHSTTPPNIVIDYSFPQTSSPTQRLLELTWAGSNATTAIQPSQQTGRVTLALPGVRTRIDARYVARSRAGLRRQGCLRQPHPAAMRPFMLAGPPALSLRRHSDPRHQRQHAHERRRSVAGPADRAARAHLRQPCDARTPLRPRLDVGLRRIAPQRGWKRRPALRRHHHRARRPRRLRPRRHHVRPGLADRHSVRHALVRLDGRLVLVSGSGHLIRPPLQRLGRPSHRDALPLGPVRGTHHVHQRPAVERRS